METPSIPNTGRILDYWLGGSHHFLVDVEAAKVFEQVYPQFPKVFRTLRDYIGRASRYIESQGIDQFVVFGSGLPTCDNVHEAVPQAKVLYTDIDAANIQLGQELLANSPNANYTFCDAKNLNSLDQSVVTETLGSLQRLGIVFVGVSAFIPDDILTEMLDKLYDWVPAGSFLALDFDGEAGLQYPQLIELMDSLDAHLYMRNPATIKPLLGRWQLSEHGILPVSAWQAELPIQHREITEPVFMYGCLVYK
ncbi:MULTISPECIES: SAM-dependent methyltransferase [unclassified Nodularia (in: cyanobacteria)]|uniref:SAM-dependent methyltransferase n=1 Tax=unclassified Nodularia (in: cyanobacteria) TaxID=2656917 RepID=UPI00187F1257|nr:MULTISPECIES: SAM-dependent methyltransferase [unclassified Nodularia (in: cyanobacteria)]MBE9200254.1 SAM-dependent methyltransferase [Nodularia sp. LEGE 06071]MCC2693397.1 SAM-dependent methyltransferase [Nodularia sp. LEGE 04288]